MIKVRAKIKLYEGKDKRQTSFTTGYRPLFEFIAETKISGQITLINQKEFRPGEEGVAEIAFIHQEYLGRDFGVGKTAKFYEGKEPLGEAEILELL